MKRFKKNKKSLDKQDKRWYNKDTKKTKNKFKLKGD